MMRQHRSVAARGALLVLLLIALGACSSTRRDFPAATRTSTPTISAYPRATRPTTGNPAAVLGTPIPTLRFTTTDPPGDVLAYYRQQYVAQGWTVSSDDGRALILVERHACPYWGLYVYILAAVAGRTDVEVRFDDSPNSCQAL